MLKLIAQARRRIGEKIQEERKIREENLERVAKKKRKREEMREVKNKRKEAVLQFNRKNLEAQINLEMDNRASLCLLEQEYDDKIAALKTEKHNRMVEMNKEHQANQEEFAREIEEELNKLLSQEADIEEEADQTQAVQPSAPQCPVCLDTMTPPIRIFQCGTGHLVCASCRPRLQVIHSISQINPKRSPSNLLKVKILTSLKSTDNLMRG